tara:strand:- start:1536 stop:2108 length:573 start_codon:yes stop_codon:yes gene_type:complete
MNPYIIYILILIIIVLILIGIIYLGYWIPKKMGKRKIGILISRILAIGIILMILSFIFEDNLFFKSDAKEFLEEQKIELNDNFKILKNESGGFMDYYHKFELEISLDDKNRLIDKITSEPNYVNEIQNSFHLPDKDVNRYETDTITANYQTDWEYKTEIYYSNGKGYTPTYKIVSFSKKENKLTFEHILD